MESGEQRIGGVLIELFDKQGNKVAETRTDAVGRYSFLNLYAGEYTVKESQPSSFADGKDSLGSVAGLPNGLASNDRFNGIVILGGQKGDHYNFGEIKLGSISGTIHADTGDDCVYDPVAGDQPLAGVTVVLLNEQGQELARKQTDIYGKYAFNGLRPGTYIVRELGPSGYIDGKETAGTVGGQTRGTVTNDRISGITLTSGDKGINYDFCEKIPAAISGTVYHDRNNNGVQDGGEEGIGNTKVVLYDKTGLVIAETLTNAQGDYRFANLIGGEYVVKEVQPSGFIDGKDSSGKVNGLTVGETKNDELSKIIIKGGQSGVEYNFGELKLARLSGYVLVDADGNCTFDASKGDKPVANVTIDLLDSTGKVIATTKTAANGSYAFDNLLPGTYSVRQTQPNNYFNIDQMVGSADGQAGSGDASGTNIITNIVISSGQTLVQYNFCEDVPAEIQGRVWEDGPAFQSKDGQLPEGYRSQRDGIYQSGVDRALAGVKMQLYFYIDPTSGVIAPRQVTLKDVLPGAYSHLGSNPDAPVYVTTDANGQYSFEGLKAGNYIVLQQQPTGYVDANDVAGSTSGFTFNSTLQASLAPSAVLSKFSTQQVMDSVVNIRVNAGGISMQNNFTEVRAESAPTPPYLPPIDPRPPVFGGPLQGLPGGFMPGLAGAQAGSFAKFESREITLNTSFASNVDAFTWHLSVINAGTPRAISESDSAQTQWLQAGYINTEDWNRFEMDEATWSFAIADERGEVSMLDRSFDFGMIDGVPLVGDFDGDGSDEVAVFYEGYWMIDINHNGRWEQSDLLARLGTADDQPVVGDWDGDGKEDIGIYGPIWMRDPEAIANDPGLPNPDNQALTRPKNIPPTVVESTSGARIMKLTSHGRQRTDLVDHVFGTDDYRHVAITGDWNGSGMRSIATFDGGTWRLDLNGDGRFNSNDAFASFGTEGDIPLVGDFNGDGVDEIAVYRQGTWIIDSNGDRQMTDADRRIEYGTAGDKPIVGDWNGDGTDDIGLYRAKPRTL
jgi:protocatechuate 3,4-dioxygenase beta subunit